MVEVDHPQLSTSLAPPLISIYIPGFLSLHINLGYMTHLHISVVNFTICKWH